MEAAYDLQALPCATPLRPPEDSEAGQHKSRSSVCCSMHISYPIDRCLGIKPSKIPPLAKEMRTEFPGVASDGVVLCC
eukprot:3488024-Amphidinium_carterae.1